MVHKEIYIVHDRWISHHLPVNRFVNVEGCGNGQDKTKEQAKEVNVSSEVAVLYMDVLTPVWLLK